MAHANICALFSLIGMFLQSCQCIEHCGLHIMKKTRQAKNSVTHYVALALPWTLTVTRGIHVPRYSNAAWVLRVAPNPLAAELACATPEGPEPELPGQ